MTLIIGIICLVVGFLSGLGLAILYQVSKAPVWDGGLKHSDKYEND